MIDFQSEQLDMWNMQKNYIHLFSTWHEFKLVYIGEKGRIDPRLSFFFFLGVTGVLGRIPPRGELNWRELLRWRADEIRVGESVLSGVVVVTVR